MRNKEIIDHDSVIVASISRYAIYSAEDVYKIINDKYPKMSRLQSASFIRRNMEKTESGFYILKPMQNNELSRIKIDALGKYDVVEKPISPFSSFLDGDTASASIGIRVKLDTRTPETKNRKVIEKIRFAEKYNIPYEGLIELIKEMKL